MGDQSRDPAARRGFYHRFAWAYDLLIERPAGPQIEQVAGVLSDHGCDAGAHLIDAGCGTGRYTVALSQAGLTVTGVDRSRELLDLARARASKSGVTATFVEADLTAAWTPEHPAHGVLCRGVLNDLLTDGERASAFRSFAGWLRRGGVLLLDVRETERSRARYAGSREFTRTATNGRDHVTFTSRTTMAAGSDRLEVVERWQGNIAGENVTHEERFLMRTWSLSTVQRLAQAAGFSTISELGAGAVGARSDRVVVIALR